MTYDCDSCWFRADLTNTMILCCIVSVVQVGRGVRYRRVRQHSRQQCTRTRGQLVSNNKLCRENPASNQHWTRSDECWMRAFRLILNSVFSCTTIKRFSICLVEVIAKDLSIHCLSLHSSFTFNYPPLARTSGYMYNEQRWYIQMENCTIS
jgi:hypothetical protein